MKKQIFAAALSAALLCSAAAAGWTASAEIRPDIDVVIDGTERTFYNASGAEVHPISYQDTTYLPVRAIGELMGKTVSWNEKTQTVTLTGGSTVTDFDTSGPTGQTNPSTGAVSLDKAKQIALDHAGLSASKVQFIKSETDRDDGRTIYEIEFVVKSGSTVKEYDYEIDAATGKIVDYDYDVESTYDWDDDRDDWDDDDDDWDD